MSPNISDEKPKMATTYREHEEEKETLTHKTQQPKTKKYLEKPEINELRI